MAKTCMIERDKKRRKMVKSLAGKRAASAFGLGRAAYFERRLVLDDMRRPSPAVYVVPHPSGRCRWWNDAANREVAERWFKKLRKFVEAGRVLP